MTAPDARLVIPYRIRLGVVGDIPPTLAAPTLVAIDRFLDANLAELFDPESREFIERRDRITPIAFAVISPGLTRGEQLVAHHASARALVSVQMVSPRSGDEPDDSARLEAAGGASHAAYVSTGVAVVDKCDVLIVLGEVRGADVASRTPIDRAAGEVAEFARARRRPLIHLSSGAPEIVAGVGLNGRALNGLEMFNGAADAVDARTEAEEQYVRMFEAPEGRLLGDTERELVRQKLLPYLIRASALAKRYRNAYMRAGLLVYILSPLAVASVAAALWFQALASYFFLAHFFTLVTILTVVWRTDRRRARRKWIECRFLAERLRSAQFLAVCGVDASRLDTPPYMGRIDRRDEWMAMAFTEIWNGLPPLTGCQAAECRPYVGFVRKWWLEDQIAHHLRTARRAGIRSRGLERAGLVVFCMAAIVAVGHLAISWLGWFDALEHPLTFFAIVLPGVGAALGGLRAHREYSRLAKRSESLVPALTALRDELDLVSNAGQLESLLRRVEELMLAETQDWLALMRLVRLEAA